jgi:hypothetical protein
MCVATFREIRFFLALMAVALMGFGSAFYTLFRAEAADALLTKGERSVSCMAERLSPKARGLRTTPPTFPSRQTTTTSHRLQRPMYVLAVVDIRVPSVLPAGAEFSPA